MPESNFSLVVGLQASPGCFPMKFPKHFSKCPSTRGGLLRVASKFFLKDTHREAAPLKRFKYARKV